jgi:hypothetical protein
MDFLDVYECKKFMSRAKRLWLLEPDNPVRYKKAKLPQFTYYKHIYADLCNFMVDFLQARYETMLIQKKATLEDIRNMLDKQPIDNVYWRMIDMVNIWAMRIAGPVENLGKIATDRQSVHAVSVTKNTNDGIFILEKQLVPIGQKTLAEIEKEWLKVYHDTKVKKVIADMKDWGSRKQVMDKMSNKYKSVLRGLWAKIKTFDSELKSELTKRLWEECTEALGMCADGHVGRLVNVLIGFDEQFKNSVSPKEYFQNNISLIAKSSVPMPFKLEQAKRLMDDIEMPEEERQVWLEAL